MNTTYQSLVKKDESDYVFKLNFIDETPFIKVETKEKFIRDLNNDLEVIKKDFTCDYKQQIEIAKLRLDLDNHVHGYFSSIDKLKKRWLENTNLHIDNLVIYKQEVNDTKPSDMAIYSVPTIGTALKIRIHKDAEEIKPNMFLFNGYILDLNKKNYCNEVFYTNLEEAKEVLNNKINDNIKHLTELNNKVQNI